MFSSDSGFEWLNGTIGNSVPITSSSGISMLPSVINQPPSLVIRPGTLSGGQQYVFGLRLTSTGNSTNSEQLDIASFRSNVTLDVNDVPRSGNVTVKPLVGYAQETEFTVSVAGFLDPDLPCKSICYFACVEMVFLR